MKSPVLEWIRKHKDKIYTKGSLEDSNEESWFLMFVAMNKIVEDTIFRSEESEPSVLENIKIIGEKPNSRQFRISIVSRHDKEPSDCFVLAIKDLSLVKEDWESLYNRLRLSPLESLIMDSVEDRMRRRFVSFMKRKGLEH